MQERIIQKEMSPVGYRDFLICSSSHILTFQNEDEE